MTTLFRLLCLAFIAASTAADATPVPSWVVRSNQLTQTVLQDSGLFMPELESANGSEEFDVKVIDLMPHVFERRVAALKARRESLIALRPTESDPKVLQDLDILISSRDSAIAEAEIGHQYLLTPVEVAAVVNWGLETLLDANPRGACSWPSIQFDGLQ